MTFIIGFGVPCLLRGTLPRVAQELISQCMLYLLQIMDQPPCVGAVEAALVLFMSSPLVLWP